MTRLLVVVLALAAAGCIEGAPEPLTPTPDAALDPGLVRAWRCLAGQDDPPLRLEVRETGEKTYGLSFAGPDDDDGAEFEGHASRVGDHVVLNVRDKGDLEDGWYFGVLTLHAPEVLEIRYVEITEPQPPARDQVAAALASGQGLVQVCVCRPYNKE